MRKTTSFLLLTVLLLFAGCSERAHTPRILPEWGRAGRIGTASHSTPIGLHVSSNGDVVVMVWPERAENTAEDHLRLRALDAYGDVIVDQDLGSSTPDIHTVRLISDDRGTLHLVWSSGEPATRTLWHASLPDVHQLDPTSKLSLTATPVSPMNVPLTWHKTTPGPSGSILIFWLDREGNLVVSSTAGEHSQPLLADVVGADVQIDNTGNAHITWATQTSPTQVTFHYAQLDTTTLTLDASTPVATAFLSPRTSLDTIEGPTLSLDHEHAYISWVQRQNVPARIIKQLHIATLVLDDLSTVSEFPPLTHNNAFPPAVYPAEGHFAYQHLAPFVTGQTGQFNVRHAPETLHTQNNETVLAVSVQYATHTRQEYQPTLVFLRDGTAIGYQALTWTDHPSADPIVVADATRNLYVAWIDTTGESYHYPIYFASTAPALKASWARPTPRLWP